MNRIVSITLCRLLALSWIGFAGCDCNKSVQRPNPSNLPENVRMVIDEDSIATRDTTLRIWTTGTNIDFSKYAADSLLESAPWDTFEEVTLFEAPKIEGDFTIYGKFASAGGGSTAVMKDNIRFDFSAVIDSFKVDAPSDTLYPGQSVSFRLITTEIGVAHVSFGNLITYQPLDSVGLGVFRGSLGITRGLRNPAAEATAFFTDWIGNHASPVTYRRVFVIEGATLELRKVSSLDIPNAECDDVFYTDDYCFLSDWDGSLHVVNVFSFEYPVPARDVSIEPWSYGMDFYEGFLYVANTSAGVAVINIHPPREAKMQGWVHMTGEPHDVLVDGNHAYVGLTLTGLSILDLLTPDTPYEISSLGLTDYGHDLFLRENLLYVTGPWGVAIVDISVKESPRLVSEFPIDGSPIRSLCYENHLLVTTIDLGLLVYDISNPYSPVRVAVYPEYENATAALLRAPYLILGGYDKLWVLLINQPWDLTEVGRLNNQRLIRGMYATERHLFLAESGGMSIVELYPEQ